MVMLSCCQVPLKFVAGKKIFAIKRCNLQWKWNHISPKKYATAESNKTLSTVFDQCSMLACLAKTFSAMFKFGSFVAEIYSHVHAGADDYLQNFFNN